MSILRFQTNVPVEVALAYSDGKEVEGQYGPQQMFSLAESPNGEKTMYVPPIVAERFKELHIDRGQRVQVCKAEVKNGQRRGIEWQVTRIDPDPRCQNPPRPEPPAPLPAKVNGAAVPVRAGGDPGNGQSITPVRAANGNGHTPLPFSASGHGQYCLSALVNTIDMCIAAEQYAQVKGRDLHFTSEDIRAFTISFFIQHSRENGGLR